MGVNSDDTVGVVEIVRHEKEVKQIDADNDVVESFTREIDVVENNEARRITEVHRTIRDPEEIEDKVAIATTVNPLGTVLNVGAGPELPPNPYEGLIWIKT